jgi:hypothetical protein
VDNVTEVATLPAYQTLVELFHNRAWALLLTATFTSRKSSILASCRLANTLALVKYKLANSITLEVVRKGLKVASVTLLAPTALPPPIPLCEYIRALVIIFPDLFLYYL